jgi:VWFA-related protein
MENLLRVIYIIIQLSAISFITSTTTNAQQLDNSKNTISINTDLVVTWAQIINLNDGSPIRGLRKVDLNLRDQSKPQQIDIVKEGQPLSVVILMPTSTCEWVPGYEFHRSLEAFRQLGKDTEISFITWGLHLKLISPFTSDHQKISELLDNRVTFNGPQNFRMVTDTDLAAQPGTAIFEAAKYLNSNSSPERRKIILIVGGGELHRLNPQSKSTSEVLAFLDKTNTTVFALFEHKLSYKTSLIVKFDNKIAGRKSTDDHSLEKFISSTGGSYLFASQRGDDQSLIKLTRMMRSFYTIGYYPDYTNSDDEFRRIKLELSKSGKAKFGKVDIRTREGYHAVRRVPDSTPEQLK